MGITLPKPVMTKVYEREGNAIFRSGCASINGYRESMEDAHIAFLRREWGFFGVFDGHVNDKCSAYLEGAWHDALEKESVPVTDERMKELTLKIDADWMATGAEGGSTGTYFFAMKNGSKVHLQVGNVGDSRVLVCQEGSCVAMTQDHKPMDEVERLRIESCGGRVENNRVDGSLAVSRAFGDRDYKTNGEYADDQLTQKVIALADVTHVDLTFGSKDFAVLCCDGVFESNFSNEEVVEFIKEQLQTENDLAVVSGNVCSEAVRRGSRDNISCMIVQLCDGTDYAAPVELMPGPFNAGRNSSFRKMYATMAGKGGLTLEDALEKRYNALREESDVDPEESEIFGDGPPTSLSAAERSEWFKSLVEELGKDGGRDARSEQIQRFQMLQQQVGVPLPMLLSLMAGNNDLDMDA